MGVENIAFRYISALSFRLLQDVMLAEYYIYFSAAKYLGEKEEDLLGVEVLEAYFSF